MKILIVDDNAAVRRVIRVLLAGIADIYECADGTEALPLYAAERPDFVLMDVQMAVMDGITATRRIRAQDPAARVIMVSDHDQADLRDASCEAGASGYVVKDNLPEIVGLLQALHRDGRHQS